MENSNNSGKIVAAVILGAAVGGLLGVLFAPNKGSETRNKILSKGTDLSATLTDKLSEIIENVKHQAEEAITQSMDLVESEPITKSFRAN